MTTKHYDMKVRKWVSGVVAAIALFVLLPNVGLASTNNRGYYEDCGNVTCTRWISVASSKSLYANRMNSANAEWSLLAGIKCGTIGVFTFGTAGVVCGVWDGWMIYKFNRAMEDASLHNGCVKWKWSRQGGQGFPTDWTWTTPARDAKCKWS
jgi:hypothetical protein